LRAAAASSTTSVTTSSRSGGAGERGGDRGAERVRRYQPGGDLAFRFGQAIHASAPPSASMR
jgi:hypothetical protein